NAGAATLGNGTSGTSGAVSASNSLVGTSADAGLQAPVVIDTVNGNFFARFLTDTGGGGGHVRVNSVAVNHAPVVSSFPKGGSGATALPSPAAAFTGHFSDADGDALAKVRIEALPAAAAGTLKLNGTAVAAGQQIAAGDLAKLVFEPALNFSG